MEEHPFDVENPLFDPTPIVRTNSIPEKRGMKHTRTKIQKPKIVIPGPTRRKPIRLDGRVLVPRKSIVKQELVSKQVLVPKQVLHNVDEPNAEEILSTAPIDKKSLDKKRPLKKRTKLVEKTSDNV